MNNVKSVFSIKDLENLSGVKAHTIRIWEKRYGILEPMRSETNIRHYDIAALQKLLNITLLHNHGYKISKISKLPEQRIPEMVNEIISQKSVGLHALNAFKVAMMNFDQAKFFTTYDQLLSEKTFPEIFYEVILPLMDQIGLLWQTSTISPAQEHFISNLVRQKILINTETLQKIAPTRHDKLFVLYLPEGEIHEIGLMYANYEILRNGYSAIYLGANVPIDCLKDLNTSFSNIVYVSYFTIAPTGETIPDYIETMQAKLLREDSELWLLGRNTASLTRKNLPKKIRVFNSIADLVDALNIK